MCHMYDGQNVVGLIDVVALRVLLVVLYFGEGSGVLRK